MINQKVLILFKPSNEIMLGMGILPFLGLNIHHPLSRTVLPQSKVGAVCSLVPSQEKRTTLGHHELPTNHNGAFKGRYSLLHRFYSLSALGLLVQ